MTAYAHICTICDHPASRHLLKPRSVSVSDGPYVCQHNDCGCEIDQSTPMRELSKSQFEAYLAKRAD